MKTLNQELKARLRRAGVPRSYWGQDLSFQGSLRVKLEGYISSLQENFSNGTNWVLTNGDRTTRTKAVSWMAEQIITSENELPRIGPEPKPLERTEIEGEVFTLPFMVKMMNVDELGKLAASLQYDNLTTLADEVIKPDFFFLTEIGNEWPTTYFAKAIGDLVFSRVEEGLPTIVTLKSRMSELRDKHNNTVYKEVAEVVQTFDGVKL